MSIADYWSLKQIKQDGESESKASSPTHKDLQEQLKERDNELRDLLWCISHQSEKVPGRLSNILPRLFEGYPEDKIYEIRQKILSRLV